MYSEAMIVRGRMPFFPVVLFFFIFAGWKLLPLLVFGCAVLLITGNVVRNAERTGHRRRTHTDSRGSYVNLAGRVADRIIDLDDRIVATAPPHARTLYRRGTSRYLSARTTSDLRSALADLEGAEAVMEGRDPRQRGTRSRREALALIERSRYVLS